VADISFNAAGNMLLGERGVRAKSYPIPHTSRALQHYLRGRLLAAARHLQDRRYDWRENGAGGGHDNLIMAVPFAAFPLRRRAASPEQRQQQLPDAIYGYRGFRPTGGRTRQAS
jgi:hypothetical protein